MPSATHLPDTLAPLLRRARQHRAAADWPAATALYRQALNLASQAPDAAHALDARHHLALCLHASGQHTEAISLSQQVLARQADHWQSAMVLGKSLQAAQRLAEADQAYQTVLRLHPGHPPALLNRADLAMNTFGDPLLAQRLVQPLWQHPQHGHEAELTTLMASLYDRDEAADGLNQRIVDFSRRHMRLPGWVRPPLAPRPQGHRLRPRVGVMSPLLCVGPVYFLTVAGWRHLAQGCDIVVFQRGQRHDWATAELQALSTEWIPAGDLDAQALAHAIQDADLDVFYDLGGWMDPVGLQALSVKPARLQYKWVGGQSVTTGLDSFDGWIGDAAQSPLRLQHLYTEPLLLVPGGYATYTPPTYLPPPAARKLRDPVVFSNPAKLSRRFLLHLATLPGTKVFVHRQYQYPQVRERIERVLPPHSVEYVCPGSHREALEAVNQHQTMIDTFPYSSGLTAREAQAMGTRVVAQPGGTLFCERHTAVLSQPAAVQRRAR